jgi:F-type H+-transporting ATPase subunit epsilon
MADRKLKVEIVAPAAPVWSGEASFVTVPAAKGTLGIYPRHQPLLAILGTGEVRIQAADGGWLRADVTGGFVSVDLDVVTVVTDAGQMTG